MPAPVPGPGRTITPSEFKPFESKVELRCRACGKKGRYLVGRILIDPDRQQAQGPGRVPGEGVCFTGYFRCRHCGAGGPWELTAQSLLLMTALVLEATHNPRAARIQFGRMHLFDGTVVKTATEGEAHLQGLIDKDPGNAFLWSRLGNLYESAELRDRALAAWQKAVELNPQDVESHYSIGCYLMERKEPARAAEHFHLVLRHARTASRTQPQLLHDMVRDALERLLELHEKSKGAIEFLPPTEGASTGTPQCLPVRFDLTSDRGWEALTTFFLTGAPPASAKPAAPLPGLTNRSAPSGGRASAAVGRNDPCPCGSGKKFKHCCRR